MRALLKVEREWEISHGNDQREEEKYEEHERESGVEMINHNHGR